MDEYILNEDEVNTMSQLAKAESTIELLADVLRDLYHHADLRDREGEIEDHFEALGLRL
tara:strand:- start:1566 stop:1742 length:177 start_codon:yes stop_codon:yes gene_type:complete